MCSSATAFIRKLTITLISTPILTLTLTLCAGTLDHKIRLWDYTKNKCLKLYQGGHAADLLCGPGLKRGQDLVGPVAGDGPGSVQPCIANNQYVIGCADPAILQ